MKHTLAASILFVILCTLLVGAVLLGLTLCDRRFAVSTDAAPNLPGTTRPYRSAAAPEFPTASPALGIIDDDCLDYILWQESRNGMDPNCAKGIIGPAGERGPWQITPIWVEDCERLFGVTVDPYDYKQCRSHVQLWLEHYVPLAGCETHYEVHQLYRRGLNGYRRWKETDDE